MSMVSTYRPTTPAKGYSVAYLENTSWGGRELPSLDDAKRLGRAYRSIFGRRNVWVIDLNTQQSLGF